MDCPATIAEPGGCCNQAICTRHANSPRNYLQEVEELCRKHGIVFILDETITGFRWHLKGAQHTYNVRPDISTFGKAMANGLLSPPSLVGDKWNLERINKPNQERLFLLSTTHGAEMSGLSAYMETQRYLAKHAVIAHLWDYGKSLCNLFNNVAAEHGLEKFMRAAGPAANPYYLTLDSAGAASFELAPYSHKK